VCRNMATMAATQALFDTLAESQKRNLEHNRSIIAFIFFSIIAQTLSVVSCLVVYSGTPKQCVIFISAASSDEYSVWPTKILVTVRCCCPSDEFSLTTPPWFVLHDFQVFAYLVYRYMPRKKE